MSPLNDPQQTAAAHRDGYMRYSVGYAKRDWPFRPWRWKRVTATRYIRIGAKP